MKDILEQALKARIADVETYQVNINNFERAIQILDMNEWNEEMALPMQEYRETLTRLLKENRIEQMKSKIILWAIESQLGEL